MRISRVSQCFTVIPAWEAGALPLGSLSFMNSVYRLYMKLKIFVYNLYAELKHEVNSSKLNSGRLI